MSLVITNEELDAIRFYIGDIELAKKNVYRGGDKAYQTINALLNYGYRNEIDKAKEGKIVELYDSDHLKSYLKLIILVFSASLKYRNIIKDKDKYMSSYRVDRASSLDEFINNNNTIEGFFSTCKYGLLPQYAHTKKDIVLLEVIRDSKTPYIDYQDLLGVNYSKPEEAEILIPFGTCISHAKNVPLTNVEKEKYYDLNGNMPRGKWIIKLTEGNYDLLDENIEEEYYNYICNEQVVSKIIKTMKKLTLSKRLNKDEKEFYTEWKKKLIAYINSCSEKLRIKYSINNINN